LPAERQIDEAEAWWLEHRTAAPDAIADEFTAMIALLAQRPNIGRTAPTFAPQMFVAYVYAA
jgi:hypothetical protein